MNLILASLEFLSQPYDFRGLKVFCKSLRKYYNEDCVFFVRNLPLEANKILYEFDIKTVSKQSYEEKYKIIPFGINATRRVYNYLFLKNNPQYTDIICTDVTDVVFQSNPFNVTNVDGIAQISEEAKLIKDCKINAGWINGNYGTNAFEELQNKPILCAGIIRANNKNTQILNKLFVKEVQNLYSRSNGTKFGNLDQAHIEYIFHVENFNKQILPYINKSFIHIGHSAIEDITFSNNTISVLGVVPAAIHQYNRHKNIENMLYSIYD
jgi:hypothetical protein